MQRILNGIDVESEQRVLTDDPEQAAAFWSEVKSTNSWKRFLREYGNTDSNNDVVISVLDKLHGDSEFTTVGQLCDAIEVAMNSGEVQRKPQEPVVEQAPVPTDKNGRKLSPQQVLWSEYRQFSESHNMQDVRARARVDSGFASFVHKNYEREMNEVGVGDAAVNLNDRPQSNDRVIPELAAWVDAYRKMPAAEVRRRSRADFNPAGYEQFNKMLNLAIAGGLI